MRKKRKRHLDHNDARDQMINNLDIAIEAAKKSNGKMPRQLYRYRTALERLRSWEKRFVVAERKIREYGANVKYYEKRFKANEGK